MCSDCGEETLCHFCGDACGGQCSDPDSCRSCWMDRYLCIASDMSDAADFDVLEDCMDSACPCTCHENGSVVNHTEGVTSYQRQGVFPFLKLPGEVRDKIYK